jgi:hypothetical protein
MTTVEFRIQGENTTPDSLWKMGDGCESTTRRGFS